MRFIAAAISLLLALEPGILHAANVMIRVQPTAQVGTGAAAAGAAFHSVGVQTTLNPSFTPSLKTSLALPESVASVSIPALSHAVSYNGTIVPEVVPVNKAVSSLHYYPVDKLTANSASAPKLKTPFTRKVLGVSRAVAQSVKGLAHAGTADAYTGARTQIDLLTGRLSQPTQSGAVQATPSGTLRGGLKASSQLTKLREAALPGIEEAPAKAPVKAEKGGIRKWLNSKTQIFREEERNKAFWRMFLGEAIYLFGFQMYIVALPFLMKSFTKNTLQENGQLRDTTAEALNALVRENRSMARFMHWAAQAISYIAIPLFTKDGKAGPKKWLVRSALARMGILFGVPAIFFASGLLSAQAAIWVLLGLIAGQSFFQGVYVIMMSGATARLMGHKSVLPAERLRANSMRTFLSAIIAIIAPFIAGQIAGIPDWFGKAGTGSALIYGVYAAGVGIAGLIFATIRMIGSKPAQEAIEDGEETMGGQNVQITGLWSAVKNAGVSMVKGIKLVMQNRYLRTLMIIGLISSLFADPLVFNILPEFVEGVLATNPGALDMLLNVPLLGWFFKGLVGTPMGFFALLVTSSSLGSAVASLMINPLRKLFMKLGFTTEERLTIPFYVLSFLSVPAFWWMINTGSVVGLLALYGLQTFLGGFVGMVMTGIYQKKIRGYNDLQMNQVLAANSFVGILAAIAATLLYGFVLNGVAISTSLWIAGIATTVLGLIQLFAPMLLFSKGERSKPAAPPAAAKPAADAAQTLSASDVTLHGHEHLPNRAGHGPLHIGL
ncbi:MAG: hypothetical protein ABIJ96_06615 [Elusimicrobiota bacterium]